MSNPYEANCITRLSALIFWASLCATTLAKKDRCSTTIPLGLPVDPEVYAMYAAFSGMDGPATMKSVEQREEILLSVTTKMSARRASG
ncbi:uncharacterized protein AKAW2_20969S [Aspergillus luchuensis]|uniref:Uncharacterized protein n=1 Tax=Aspergillus kawachii TaxID=1069201 RepID=A0A7R7W460_ASPKA|nr:uncharacterized protein AKAW2_20969S [Aspergillus luchuensis]BCR96029.1 hypothetical protein AKAW2_20969S [Aspergillus luchuensis]